MSVARKRAAARDAEREWRRRVDALVVRGGDRRVGRARPQRLRARTLSNASPRFLISLMLMGSALRIRFRLRS